MNVLTVTILFIGFFSGHVLSTTTSPVAATEAATEPPAEPLQVTVSAIEEDAVTFDVSGSNVLYNSPVKSIKANYFSTSKHRRNRTEAPEITVENYNSMLTSTSQFSQTIKIKNLEAGRLYHFTFQAVNAAGQIGPPSAEAAVYLLPGAPDVEVRHVQDAKLVINWGDEAIGHEDYYVVTYEMSQNPGCNVTLSISTCFGNQYSFDDLQRHTTYTFTIRSHNPSGFSKAAIIEYPID